MNEPRCPHCGNDDKRMLELIGIGNWLCEVCSKSFKAEMKDDNQSTIKNTGIKRDKRD